MSDEAVEQAVIDYMKKSPKKKLSVKDITKGITGFDRKAVQDAIKSLEAAGKLRYWSSGSTIYIVLPENYQDAASETE